MIVSALEHPIKSVTVYKSSKAEVTRVFALELAAGQNTIEIHDLPSVLDRDNVRVSGLGNARLYDVVCNIGVPKSFKSEPAAVRKLRSAKAALESEKRVREHESNILVSYGNSLRAEHQSPDSALLFLEKFVEQGRKNLDAASALDDKIAKLDEELYVELNRKNTKKGACDTIVTVVIGVSESSTVELRLTYIVTNASWNPVYELHAVTEKSKPSNKVKLHYRARITQSTGEDWSNTALTLSTVATGINTQSIPGLLPVYIRPRHKTSAFTGFANKGTTSLFGGAQSNSSNVGGGLFGSKNAGASAFGNGVNPFGSAAQPQAAQAFTGSGLFGQQQQTQGAALFGSQPSQAPPAAGGLFGGPAAPAPQGQQPFVSRGPLVPGGGFGASQPIQMPVQQQAATFGSASQPPQQAPAAPPPASEEEDEFEEVEGDASTALSEPSMVVSETPLAISYSVDDKVSIPSDGDAHQVSVAVLPFEAHISYTTAPRADPRIYLHCMVKNTSTHRLLPGAVTVIMDDSYVSRAQIGDVNTGDYFHCTLGNDPSARVTYSRKSETEKQNAGTFAEQWNITKHTTKITVHNLHQFSITNLVIRETVPISEDNRVKVVLKKPEGLADAGELKEVKVTDQPKGGKDLRVTWGVFVRGKNDGRFEWRGGVEGGEKIELEEEWEVKTPADEQWVETSDSVGGHGLFGGGRKH